MTRTSDSTDATSKGEEQQKKVYRVLHSAFKTEYVVANDPEEARNAAVGGWDHGDYAYGETQYEGEPVGDVRDLGKIPQIGDTTVERLLNAESAVALGPATSTNILRDADVTRLRNQLEQPANEKTLHDSS